MLHLRIDGLKGRPIMANLKKDERKPLSKAIVQEIILRESKGHFIMDLALTFAFVLIGAIATAIISLWWDSGVIARILGVLFCAPFWCFAAFFLFRGIRNRLRILKDIHSDLLSIETAEVISKSTEIRNGRKGYPITFHMVELNQYGSHPIGEAIWTVTNTGDTIYVAALKREKPQVIGIYPALTHKFIES